MVDSTHEWEEGDAHNGGKRYYGYPKFPSLPPIDIRPEPFHPAFPTHGGFQVRSQYADEVPANIPDDEFDAMIDVASDMDEDPAHGLSAAGLPTAEDAMRYAEAWSQRRLQAFNEGHGKG